MVEVLADAGLVPLPTHDVLTSTPFPHTFYRSGQPISTIDYIWIGQGDYTFVSGASGPHLRECAVIADVGEESDHAILCGSLAVPASMVDPSSPS